MDKLNKEMFEDVILFTVAEPGAMGVPGIMGFWRKNGECFEVDYLSEETLYEMLKELFPILKDCYWDGPMRNESAAAMTIVVGGSPDDRETQVAPGWKHKYMDFGNHLAVKEELAREMESIFRDKRVNEGKTHQDIVFNWEEYLREADFFARIDEIAEAYWKQKHDDEIIAEKINQANQNPEYREKLKAVSGDMDALMAVLKEYTGLEMDWFELKQFGLRQMELI